MTRFDEIHQRLREIREEAFSATNGDRKRLETEAQMLYAEKRNILAEPEREEQRQKEQAAKPREELRRIFREPENKAGKATALYAKRRDLRKLLAGKGL